MLSLPTQHDGQECDYIVIAYMLFISIVHKLLPLPFNVRLPNWVATGSSIGLLNRL